MGSVVAFALVWCCRQREATMIVIWQESLMQAYLAFLKGEVDGAGLI